MHALIAYDISREIHYGVTLNLKGFVDVDAKEIARAMRHLVANDAPWFGARNDMVYDPVAGVVWEEGVPEHQTSSNPLYMQLLRTADMLDGSDMRRNLAQANEEKIASLWGR